MPIKRRTITSALLGLAAAPAGHAAAPRRSINVLATTDPAAALAFNADFEQRHPGWRVDFQSLGSVELVQRYLAEGEAWADLLWSSAMDLQIKLVNDGHAARYDSPHLPHLPRWAVWKQEAYGSSSEPVALVYHRQLLGPAALPASRGALAALLRADLPRLRGRVATYDIERAGLGYLMLAQDARVAPNFWDLVEALGGCQPSLHADTLSMLQAVAAGRVLLAYNVLGSYAEAFARRQPEIGIVYLQDYTLVASRVAFISRRAPNPQGARLWLDHLLSAPGQRLLAQAGGLHGVRLDAAANQPGSAGALGLQLGAAARPIALGPGLLAHLDQSKRQAFVKRWRVAMRLPR